MATPLRIRTEIGKLCANYRHHLSADEFALIAGVWAEQFAALRDEDFSAAIRAHMGRSRWFPCPAEIIQAHVDRRQSGSLLPRVQDRQGTSTPEDRRRSAMSGAMLSARLRGNQAARDFFRPGADWKRKEAIARAVLGEGHPALE